MPGVAKPWLPVVLSLATFCMVAKGNLFIPVNSGIFQMFAFESVNKQDYYFNTTNITMAFNGAQLK